MTRFSSILALATSALFSPALGSGRVRSGYDFAPSGDDLPDYITQLPRRDRGANFYDSGKPKAKRAARRASAKAKEAVRLAKARKDCGHEG